MPPKNLLLEIGSREFICRSCLSSLRRRPQPAPWGARQSSQAAQAVQATGATQPRTKAQRTKPVDDAERLRTLKALGLTKEQQDKGYTVNYFEQGKDGKIRRLDGPGEFGESLTDPGGEMAAELKKLEEELYGAIGQKIEEDELDQLRKQGQNEAGTDADEEVGALELDELLDMEEDGYYETSSGSIYIREGPLRLDSHHTEHLHFLNRTFRRLENHYKKFHGGGKRAAKTRLNIWRSYSKLRKPITAMPSAVPAEAWDLMWTVLAVDHPDNTNRMHHIYILGSDMNKAGVKLSDERQLLVTEAMFILGWKKEAIENHRRCVTTIGSNPKTSNEFWGLGLRMYSLMGDIVRAERIADNIMNPPYEPDPRVLLPLIRACAENPDTVEKGYTIYRRMRSMLGTEMAIDDYDRVISYFLTSHRMEQALWIFTDMMTGGSVDLRGMPKFPSSVSNPFFFGKWIKRLVLSGDLNGAYSVLQLMRNKGVTPMAITVNAMIGSLLRSETANNVTMAEETAWAMINSRIQFVKNRERAYSSLDNYIKLDMSGSSGWPRANLETLCLLAENYKDRGLYKKMGQIWHAFRECDLTQPGAFLMNQLLFSKLKEGKGAEVPDTFRSLTAEFNIDPDPYTFTALWQALPVSRLLRLSPNQVPTEIAQSRKLFAEMVSHKSNFEEGGVHPSLVRLIMHSFRKLDDKVGMLVAIRALRQVFNLPHAEYMVLELMTGSIDMEKSTRSPIYRRRLIVAGQHVQKYLDHRQKEMVAAGELQGGLDELPADMKALEMTNFLEIWLETQLRAVKNVEKRFREAAQQMGVYNPNSGGGDTSNGS